MDLKKIKNSIRLTKKRIILLIIFLAIVISIIIYKFYPSDKFIAIATGGNHFLALKADGSIVAW